MYLVYPPYKFPPVRTIPMSNPMSLVICGSGGGGGEASGPFCCAGSRHGGMGLRDSPADGCTAVHSFGNFASDRGLEQIGQTKQKNIYTLLDEYTIQ